MQRRDFLRHAGTAAAALSTGTLAGCTNRATRPSVATQTATAPLQASTPTLVASLQSSVRRLAPIRASIDRITGIYVGTRPFRAAGPRIESEKLKTKTIVHNYGHGGSGWSLSWGSSTLALRLAQTTGVKHLGVIGCGALGLTSALLAQRAGMSVRIYAKALPPEVVSSLAAGEWSPSSRFCEASYVPSVRARWEEMAHISFGLHQNQLGLPGDPVQWIDGYSLSDPSASDQNISDEPEYGRFGVRFTPHGIDLPAGSTPFPPPYTVRSYSLLMFNISVYLRMLMADFRAAGGEIVIRDFTRPDDLLKLPETTLINATGYGARALFGDESVIPVRGQTARLIPQPEVTYMLDIENISVVPRREGLLVQAQGPTGNFNNSDVTPDRAESEVAVAKIADLFAHMHDG